MSNLTLRIDATEIKAYIKNLLITANSQESCENPKSIPENDLVSIRSVILALSILGVNVNSTDLVDIVATLQGTLSQRITQ